MSLIPGKALFSAFSAIIKNSKIGIAGHKLNSAKISSFWRKLENNPENLKSKKHANPNSNA
jgi:hypothetical protein